LGARPRSTGRRAAGQRVDARVRESQQQTWEGMMAVATMERERWTASETARTSRTSVGGLERWLSMGAGGALGAYGVKRRSVPGGAAALAGAALLYWGATGHSAVKKAIGRTRRTSGHAAVADRGSDTRTQLGGPAGIHVEEWITVDRPVAEVYRFWRNLENLPRFMNHLESVAQREGGISHWAAKGPAGTAGGWAARHIDSLSQPADDRPP